MTVPLSTASSLEEAQDLLQSCYFHIMIMDAGFDSPHKTIYQNKWFDYTVVCACSEKLTDYDDPVFVINNERETGIIPNDVLYIPKDEVYKDMTYVKTEEIETLLDDLFKGVYREWFRNPVNGRVEANDYVEFLICRVQHLHDPIKHIELQPELHDHPLWGVDRFRLPGLKSSFILNYIFHPNVPRQYSVLCRRRALSLLHRV